MSNGADKPNDAMVEVRVERLFAVIRALIKGGLADAVVERYKDQVVLIPLDQMQSFENFVNARLEEIDSAATAAAGNASLGQPNTFSANLRAVMPSGGFGHCTRR